MEESSMPVDMFLKLDPVKGESQDHKHKDEIEVLSWSWGVAQSGTMHSGTGGGAGKVHVNDLTFTHWYDKSSVDLLKACTHGDHIAKGELTVRKAGGKDALEYIKITMTNIIVTNVSNGGSHGEDRLTENITLNFQKFKVEYKQQTEKGAAGASPNFGWDIAANKEQ
jgi:type VI secretion system secreted protein Hcp